MYKLLVKSLLLLFVFSSCSKIIDIDIPDKEKHIDVIGVMNTDSIINVNLSKSVSILKNTDDSYSSSSSNIDFVNDATVKIYENNVYKDTLSFIDYGNYRASFKPIAGNNYKIEVSVPNCEKVDAENIIPDKVNIESIDTLTIYDPNFYDNMLRCKIRFTDPSDISNYYYLNIERKSTNSWYDEQMDSIFVWTDSSKVYFQTNDPIIDDDAWVNNGVVFNDNVINGQTYTLFIDLDKYYSDSTIVHFNLYSISEDYYLYLQSYSKQKDTQEDPFSESVPVYTNINNGVGIFAGINKSTYSILARNPDDNY